jgi:hypothetical protein
MEVHPPDHPIMTWKQFLVHMSTICLGLLIALGLEHVAELVHQHEQIKQAREALDLERRKNIVLLQQASIESRREQVIYSGNLAALEYIKAHPNAPLNQLPAAIQWVAWPYHLSSTAWHTLRSNSTASLMPSAEMQKEDGLYSEIELFNTRQDRVLEDMFRASQYAQQVTDPRMLSPAQLDQVIGDTKELLNDQFFAGVTIAYFCSQYPWVGFDNCLTYNEAYSWDRGSPHTRQDFISTYGPAGESLQKENDQWAAQQQALDAKRKALDESD